ncbi:T9SS type A sorting domain-containing protein [Dyadobacter sp. 22481]|uniref:T9SS type A sorting domain-containing protein n=1 Tax=Dyadobacter sp. 22481 TaxID=3453926 RepID=UPI003F855C11
MKKKFIIGQIVLLLFFFYSAQAQQQTLNIGCTAPVANSFDGQPGNTLHVYVATISNLDNCGILGATCYYKWEVTEGIIIGAPPATPNKREGASLNTINVKWNNTTNPGKIKVTSGAGGCSGCPGLTKEQSINIRYLGTPGAISVNGTPQSGFVNIPCPNTTITLSVGAVTNATDYYWETPWGNANGQTVNVTTGTNLSGIIKVRASRSDVSGFSTYSNDYTVYPDIPYSLDMYLGGNDFPGVVEFCNTSQSITVSPDCLDGDSFQWVTTGGAKVNGSSGTIITPLGTPVVLSATSHGSVTMRGRIASCGVLSTTYITKQLYQGPPTYTNGYYTTNGLNYGLVESDDSYPNSFCWTGNPTQGDAKLDIAGLVTNTWTKLSSTPANLPWAQNQWNGIGLTFKAPGQQGMFRIVYGNSCGSFEKWYGFTVANCSQLLTVFPNPSTQDAITIQFDNVENEEAMPQQIALFSEKSTSPVRTVSAVDVFKRKAFKDNNKIEIDTRGLEKGVYYLHIAHGKKVNKEKEKIRLLIE